MAAYSLLFICCTVVYSVSGLTASVVLNVRATALPCTSSLRTIEKEKCLNGRSLGEITFFFTYLLIWKLDEGKVGL
jgi:hypothetical protein